MNWLDEKNVLVLGEPITLEDFVSVARFGRKVEFSPEYIQRVNRSRALVEQWVEEERVMYGVTTGFGALCTKAIGKEETAQLQENIIPQFRGGEGNTVNRMYADPNNKIMRGFLAPGCTIGLHTHDTSSEIIYILSGKGKVLCDGEYEPLEAGSCHYCPKGHAHSLINDQEEGNLEFFAVVPEHGA